MDISLETVQEMAPDQASLNAAKKLLKPAKWSAHGKAPQVNAVWGQCQGSGANPYYTVADVVNEGYKCTCPSRKFPCKHVLALLWQFADDPQKFVEGDPPEWVQDWLARRRKTTNTATEKSGEASQAASSKNAKNIHLAGTETADASPELSAEQQARQEAAKRKRQEKLKANTEAAITEGLQELRQWTADQLRTGISHFLKELQPRCRRIASRLVDAKAAALASRIDELPAKILTQPVPQQPATAFRELGQLILLANAWQADPDDPDTRRAVSVSENREQLLDNPAALSRTGLWENIGEQIYTRRDGLISHTTWLINLSAQSSEFAVLQDYYPAATGRRSSAPGLGSQIQGELRYYPSRVPTRAIIVEQESCSPSQPFLWPVSEPGIAQYYQQQLRHLPWSEQCLYILGEGRIVRARDTRYWWQGRDQHILPLSPVTAERFNGGNSGGAKHNAVTDLILGSQLQRAFVLWDGESAQLISVQSEQWGTLVC